MASDALDDEEAITRTDREQILLYLYREGETLKEDIQNDLSLDYNGSNRDFKYLKENDFINLTNGSTGGDPYYEVTGAGEEFVEEKLLSGD